MFPVLDRLPAVALAALGAAVVAGPPPEAARAEEQTGAQECRTHISSLRYRIGGEDALEEGDHELLGGLSSAEAGAPRENWFGEPPEREALLVKLNDAAQRADSGDVAGCIAMVEDVRATIEEPGGVGGDTDGDG